MSRADEWKRLMDACYAKHPEAKEAVEMTEAAQDAMRIHAEAQAVMRPKAKITTTNTTSQEQPWTPN